MITRLNRQLVKKPWGCSNLPACFEPANSSEPIGEIWFGDATQVDLPLLVKYLFTSERLSIQVHPDDPAARAAGYPSGKDEAWLILKAEADAELGLGLNKCMSRAALRQAALDGSIIDHMDWRRATAGDFYYSPAGTIHALGPGLTLVEVQQNVDATYRLYDYGRPRELHLDEAVAVADTNPFNGVNAIRTIGRGRRVLKEGAAFVVEQWTGAMDGTLRAAPDLPVWMIPLAGAASIGRQALRMGEVWIADGPVGVELSEEDDVLVAYEEQTARRNLIR